MRKILASFLIVTMLVSTMVCGCWHPAQAASHSDHHSSSDHHHDGDDGAPSKQECVGTDMQLPQQASINAPDLKNSFHFDYTLSDQHSAKPLLLAHNSGIRGPPPDWPSLAQTHPSILLTTQRFLI
jgi:hypothetical protein